MFTEQPPAHIHPQAPITPTRNLPVPTMSHRLHTSKPGSLKRMLDSIDEEEHKRLKLDALGQGDQPDAEMSRVESYAMEVDSDFEETSLEQRQLTVMLPPIQQVLGLSSPDPLTRLLESSPPEEPSGTSQFIPWAIAMVGGLSTEAGLRLERAENIIAEGGEGFRMGIGKARTVCSDHYFRLDSRFWNAMEDFKQDAIRSERAGINIGAPAWKKLCLLSHHRDEFARRFVEWCQSMGYPNDLARALLGIE